MGSICNVPSYLANKTRLNMNKIQLNNHPAKSLGWQSSPPSWNLVQKFSHVAQMHERGKRKAREFDESAIWWPPNKTRTVCILPGWCHKNTNTSGGRRKEQESLAFYLGPTQIQWNKQTHKYQFQNANKAIIYFLPRTKELQKPTQILTSLATGHWQGNKI